MFFYDKKDLKNRFSFSMMKEKEVKMDLNYLGVPTHLMPDTAMYIPMMPKGDNSYVAYPDMGEGAYSQSTPLSQVCISTQNLDEKAFYQSRQIHTNEG